MDNPPTATFIVRNTSKEPLIIEQANPTCGCTIGDYTKSPIAPGKEGWIKATYNAKNIGAFDKHLTVKFAGITETKSITIKGEVLSADDYAKISPVPAQKMEVKTKVEDNKIKTVTKTEGKKTSKVKIKSKNTKAAPATTVKS